jgi:hypothetical protein
MNNKKYCKNCTLWYCTYANQCNIPSSGLELLNNDESSNNFNIAIGKVDSIGVQFIKSHLKYIDYVNENKTLIYGHPSELNKNNDCYFYSKPLSLWQVFKKIFG